MSLEDALRNAASRNGVEQEFYDVFRQRHVTSMATNRAILTALGFDCSSEEALYASLDERTSAEQSRCLPPVMVVSENEGFRMPVSAAGQSAEIILETRERLPYTYDMRLAAGYHEVRAGECAMRLIVTPDCAYRPETRQAGIGVMLHGLRSRRNWGCGDFRDLRDIVDWARESLHASFVALNPLHAIHNRLPYNISPYLPTSIFFRNFLYLDVESVPGFDAIRQKFEDSETRGEIERLRAAEQVAYEKVAALKRRALDMIFEVNPPGRDCKDWIAAEGDLLRRYATWCALDQHLHRENPNIWVWPDWPEELRDPAGPAVAKFAREHEREILFYGWVQWLVDRQLAAVQKHAREIGMSIGLYHDMALATDGCGSDLWGHRRFYVTGCRVGAPPDEFSPSGQDWSFPPPRSDRHTDNGYRHLAESIRKSLRHGGALRIDHVMRLFRLYWIPKGQDPANGAYVLDRPEDVIRILALESVRNKAVIIGEDLGTVEPAFRRTLAKFGILSYRLLWFERTEAGFRKPNEYPAQALVSSTTHDLATAAGFWTCADIESRRRAGTADEDAYRKQLADRVHDKQNLLNALHEEHLLPPGHERDAQRIPELTGELHNAIMGYIARTSCALWLINQEDITKEPAQQNLPGTTDEYPNWTRKMRWSIEQLRELREARDCAAMLRNWVEQSGRSAVSAHA